MLKEMKIRIAVLTVHGTLALVLAIAFLYLSATMTNVIFEAFAIVLALLLGASALLLAALADFFAACSEGMKHFHRFVLYLVAGIATAAVGAALGYSLQTTLLWLLAAAALHAFVAGLAEIVSAARAKARTSDTRTTGLFGLISVALSGAMAGMASVSLSNIAAIVMLAAYMGFLAAKLFTFAWNLETAVLAEEKPAAAVLSRPRAA